MESIINQVISYLTRAMDAWAKKKALNFLDVQLCFMLASDQASVTLWYCSTWRPVEETTIKKALNMRIDILGIAGATEAFIGSAIMKLAEKEGLLPADIRIMVQRKDQDDVVLHLYNKGTAIRLLENEEIFDPQMLTQS
jgi:hypothetical protein